MGSWPRTYECGGVTALHGAGGAGAVVVLLDGVGSGLEEGHGSDRKSEGLREHLDVGWVSWSCLEGCAEE